MELTFQFFKAIFNCLDTDLYSPIDKALARAQLNLPQDLSQKIILFGAINATLDPRKGFSLLLDALKYLAQKNLLENIHLVVFGGSLNVSDLGIGIKLFNLGPIHDHSTLRTIYSAADVMVVPSTEEAFGQTASEAMACGTNVVGFLNTGLTDIIDHKLNGHLAKPKDATDLANGIVWVLENANSSAAREKAIKTFSLTVIGQELINYYHCGH